MELVLIGIGGAAGSVVRYQLGKMIAQKSDSGFPFGTFFINISGALLLGVVTGLDPARNVSLTLAEGFLGAYTTFSTFMYEGFHLFQDNQKKNAFVYIAGTLILGVIGYSAGYAIGRLIQLI